MRWQEYLSELVQATIVGAILAGVILIIVQVTGLQIGNVDPSLALITIMFFVGVISAWWALFRLKGKSFLGIR